VSLIGKPEHATSFDGGFYRRPDLHPLIQELGDIDGLSSHL